MELSSSVMDDPSVKSALKRLEHMAEERDGLDAQVKALAAMEAQVRGMELAGRAATEAAAAASQGGPPQKSNFAVDADFVRGLECLEGGDLVRAGRHFQGALARFRMTADGSGPEDVEGAANARLMLAQTRLAQGAAERAVRVAGDAVEGFAVGVPSCGGTVDGAENRAAALKLLDGTLEGMMRAFGAGGASLHKAVDGLLGELGSRTVRCEALLSLFESGSGSGAGGGEGEKTKREEYAARALEDGEVMVALMGKLPQQGPGMAAGRVWMLYGSAARACGELDKADAALGESVKAWMREGNGGMAVCALHVRAAVAAEREDPGVKGWGVEGQKHLTYALLVARKFGLSELAEETQRMVDADPVAAAEAAQDKARREAARASVEGAGAGAGKGAGAGAPGSAIKSSPPLPAVEEPVDTSYDALDSLD